MKRTAIGIDIDGVLVDTINHSAAFISERSGRAVSAWDIIHGWSSVEGLDQFYMDYGYELLGTLPPYEHAVEVLAGLCRQRQVYLVSARGEYNRVVTEAWLAEHGIKPHGIVLTGGGAKLPICRLHEIGIFVEDSPLNARDLAGAGLPVLLLDTEYNRYLECEGVTRCRDWLEIDLAIAAWQRDLS